jgi:hypothetical protein
MENSSLVPAKIHPASTAVGSAAVNEYAQHLGYVSVCAGAGWVDAKATTKGAIWPSPRQFTRIAAIHHVHLRRPVGVFKIYVTHLQRTFAAPVPELGLSPSQLAKDHCLLEVDEAVALGFGSLALAFLLLAACFSFAGGQLAALTLGFLAGGFFLTGLRRVAFTLGSGAALLLLARRFGILILLLLSIPIGLGLRHLLLEKGFPVGFFPTRVVLIVNPPLLCCGCSLTLGVPLPGSLGEGIVRVVQFGNHPRLKRPLLSGPTLILCHDTRCGGGGFGFWRDQCGPQGHASVDAGQVSTSLRAENHTSKHGTKHTEHLAAGGGICCCLRPAAFFGDPGSLGNLGLPLPLSCCFPGSLLASGGYLGLHQGLT